MIKLEETLLNAISIPYVYNSVDGDDVGNVDDYNGDNEDNDSDDNDDDGDDNRTTNTQVEDLSEKYSDGLGINRLLNISFISTVNDKIDYPEVYPDFLIEIMKYTPKHVVANYIYYNVFLNFWNNIESAFDDLSEFCKQHIEKDFKDVVSNMVYQWYNLEESKPTISEVWEDIKTTFQMLWNQVN